MSVEIRGLEPTDWVDALILGEKVFGVGPWLFDSLHRADPERDLADVSGAWVNGELVSLVDVFMRWVRDAEGKPRKMGGIGSVATLEPFRGRGLSKALLERSLERMERAGCELSILFTGIPDHYAKHGFRSYPRFWTVGTFREERPAMPDDVQVAGYFQAEDVWPLMAPHARTFAATPLSMVRNETSWPTALRERLNRPNRATLQTQGAYAVVETGERWSVIEVAGDPDDFEKLATAVLARAGEAREVSFSVGLTGELESFARRIAENLRSESGTWTMARPISDRMSESEIEAMFLAPGATHLSLDDY